MRNIKLVIEYDGTNYNGWQEQRIKNFLEQKHTRPILTIQKTLKEAIYKVTHENIKIIGAGRTDAGVHAKAQVANFLTSSNIPTDKLPFAINAHLPEDIAIKSAEEVSLGFNARKDAKAREYMYVINNHRFRTAIERLYSHHVPFPLDVNAMKHAAEYFKGTHDFRGFCGKAMKMRASQNSKMTTYRNILRLDIEKKENFIYVFIRANSFLMHMVRYMVAALLEVGRGRMKPEDVKLYLEPTLMKWTLSRVPAKGLFLVEVEY
ncbi:MAG: tRNA pseudouridine(38-40) synthase TruA [bacterium]